jgi:hypothetical protein
MSPTIPVFRPELEHRALQIARLCLFLVTTTLCATRCALAETGTSAKERADVEILVQAIVWSLEEQDDHDADSIEAVYDEWVRLTEGLQASSHRFVYWPLVGTPAWWPDLLAGIRNQDLHSARLNEFGNRHAAVRQIVGVLKQLQDSRSVASSLVLEYAELPNADLGEFLALLGAADSTADELALMHLVAVCLNDGNEARVASREKLILHGLTRLLAAPVLKDKSTAMYLEALWIANQSATAHTGRGLDAVLQTVESGARGMLSTTELRRLLEVTRGSQAAVNTRSNGHGVVSVAAAVNGMLAEDWILRDDIQTSLMGLGNYLRRMAYGYKESGRSDVAADCYRAAYDVYLKLIEDGVLLRAGNHAQCLAYLNDCSSELSEVGIEIASFTPPLNLPSLRDELAVQRYWRGELDYVTQVQSAFAHVRRELP